MLQTLNNRNLAAYLNKQLNVFFPDGSMADNLYSIVNGAIDKTAYNFSHISLPHYKEVCFNHLNADQYTVFLYYCSNIAYQFGDITLASKLFYLNKLLHGFHCMYDTKLPDIFIVIHGVGTVLGKAEYNDYFVVTQGCTVGANGDWKYPKLSNYIIMYPNSSILGNSSVGAKIVVANDCSILNQNIKSNSVVVGKYPNTEVKKTQKERFSQFFRI